LGKYQRPVFDHRGGEELVAEIIIRINQEQVRNRSEAPLNPGIDIDIVGLGIVLEKGTEKEGPG